MKMNILIVVVGLLGFFISLFMTERRENCKVECVLVKAGFPLDVVSNFHYNYWLIGIDIVIWISFVWLVVTAAKFFFRF